MGAHPVLLFSQTKLLSGHPVMKDSNTIPMEAREAWRVPSLPGVYLIHQGKVPLYVGRAADLRGRFESHVIGTHNGDLEVAIRRGGLSFTFWLLFTQRELEEVERQLIRQLMPRFNKIRFAGERDSRQDKI